MKSNPVIAICIRCRTPVQAHHNQFYLLYFVLEGIQSSSSSEPRLTSVGPTEHFCQPLLDAVAAHINSIALNHTLKRTFGPAVQALHGPTLRLGLVLF